MLLSNSDSQKWRKEVIRKLASFAEKCPLLIGINTGQHQGVEGVYIECNQTTKFFFAWSYGTDVKTFIHQIKQELLPLYPRIEQIVYEERFPSTNEIVDEIAIGKDLSTAAEKRKIIVGSKIWRVDKILPWRQIFILQLEQTFDAEGIPVSHDTEQRKYLYNGPAVMFLREIRQGQLKSPIDAGEKFFKNSCLITRVGENKNEE